MIMMGLILRWRKRLCMTWKRCRRFICWTDKSGYCWRMHRWVRSVKCWALPWSERVQVLWRNIRCEANSCPSLSVAEGCLFFYNKHFLVENHTASCSVVFFLLKMFRAFHQNVSVSDCKARSLFWKAGHVFSTAGSLWAEMKEGTLISQNKVINL